MGSHFMWCITVKKAYCEQNIKLTIHIIAIKLHFRGRASIGWALCQISMSKNQYNTYNYDVQYERLWMLFIKDEKEYTINKVTMSLII